MTKVNPTGFRVTEYGEYIPTYGTGKGEKPSSEGSRTYDPTKAGRQVYISANGAELERKWFYASPSEWEDLYALAKTTGQPVGQMLLTLAYKEIRRIRDSQFVAPPLRHASQR